MQVAIHWNELLGVTRSNGLARTHWYGRPEERRSNDLAGKHSYGRPEEIRSNADQRTTPWSAQLVAIPLIGDLGVTQSNEDLATTQSNGRVMRRLNDLAKRLPTTILWNEDQVVTRSNDLAMRLLNGQVKRRQTTIPLNEHQGLKLNVHQAVTLSSGLTEKLQVRRLLSAQAKRRSSALAMTLQITTLSNGPVHGLVVTLSNEYQVMKP